MAQQIVVTINKDGTVAAETFGMHGRECIDHIAALENLLEAQTTDSQFTADYTTSATQQQTRGTTQTRAD